MVISDWDYWYLNGFFEHIPDDAPDGAWFQMHIDDIEYLQSAENTDEPELREKLRKHDPYDVMHAYLDKKLEIEGNGTE